MPLWKKGNRIFQNFPDYRNLRRSKGGEKERSKAFFILSFSFCSRSRLASDKYFVALWAVHLEYQ
jgi:hypothetical protein